MIDIKELRIGAHVEFNARRVKVLSIVTAYDEDVPIIIGTSSAAVEPGEIDPIPITASLLEELGFEPVRKTLGKPYEEWSREIELHTVTVTRGFSATRGRDWSVELATWNDDTVGSADVEYLHQLEGLIYLCTGIELMEEGGV